MQKKKILIIDDDEKYVEALKIIIEGAGYEVFAAFDGEEGREKIERNSPDLIILDVMMPVKDGFSLCSELKQNPKYESIPVIMLTAVGENIPRTRYSVSDGLSLEAEDYIPKPVEPQVLLEKITKLLTR